MTGLRHGEKRGQHLSYRNEEVFRIGKKTYHSQDLTAAAQAVFKSAELKAQQNFFNANYNNYREKERAARAELVEEYFKLEAQKTGRSVEELRNEALKIDEVTNEDAKLLFAASDPGASMKDFEKIAPQLRAYIAEVAKREAFEKLVKKLESEGKVALTLSRPQRGEVEIDTEPFPKFGSPKAAFKVVTFVDYFCDGCPEYNVELSKLAQDHSDKAEFVFIPFPYTRPDRSIALARGSLCAARLGRFLEFHMGAVRLGGLLKQSSPFDVAGSVGLSPKEFLQCYVKGPSVAEHLQLAQAEASKAGILSTPVSFLNGKMFEGAAGLKAIAQKLEAASPMAQR